MHTGWLAQAKPKPATPVPGHAARRCGSVASLEFRHGFFFEEMRILEAESSTLQLH
jgi:hypothetical protein